MEHIVDTPTKIRLDSYLQTILTGLSRTRIQKHIITGPVLVNDKPATVHRWLKTGDRISIPEMMDQSGSKDSGERLVPTIIHEYEEYVVLVKPAGLLVHPTYQHEINTLADWLREKYPSIISVGDAPDRPGIMHRLDRDVSGLMVIALSQRAFDYFKQEFQAHKIEKRYRCLVHGYVGPEELSIDTPIDRHPTLGRMVAQSGKISGKPAVTYARVIERFLHHTLLDVTIITGRTHQIRTHLSSVGHAIVGDKLYLTRDLRSKKTTELIDRPFLVAYHLGFIDHDGTPRSFDIPLPEDMETVLTTLRSR